VKNKLATTGALLIAVGVGLCGQANAAPEPTLGVAHPSKLPDATGLGTVRPTTISIASTGSSTVRQIVWESWGGPQAKGHGITSNGASEPNVPIDLVALDLGVCGGDPAPQSTGPVYRQLDRIAPGRTYETGVVDDLC